MVVDCGEERRIPRSLSTADLAALRAIRGRRALAGSALFAALRERIDEVTTGLEYGRPRRPAARPDRRFLRAVTWNIERGNRLDDLKAYLSAEPRLLDADVFLLNEVDIGMARSGNRDVAAELAELVGFERVFGNSYLCLAHGDARDGVHDARNPNEAGFHGNAILSRWPILRAENVDVAITRDKFESSEKRLGHKKALWAEIQTPLGPLAVTSAHLDPYASPGQRRAQLEDLLCTLDHRGLGRVLVGGDLNTTTYDLGSLPRLVWNIAAKMARGGVPHAVDHYMRPQALYERGIFEALREHGFDYEAWNAMDQGSVRYEVGTFDSESKVRDHLPGLFVHVLRRALRPWNGSVPLKIDWFAARALSALRAGQRADAGGRESLDPQVLERASWNGRRISDHDPVLVDFFV